MTCPGHAAVGVTAFLALVLSAACGGDSPTSPTETPAPTPTTLSVQISIVSAGGGLQGLDIGPATQTRELIVSGRVSAQGGTVTGLTGTFTLRDSTGATLFERGLDTLFPGVPLVPGADLVFGATPLGFDVPFPPFADADAVVQVRGMDSGGQTVTAETTVPVAVGDTRIVTGTCIPDDQTLCAFDRFKVTVDWRNDAGTGTGRVPDDGRFFDGGRFWFFAPDNFELLVQVLDQCPVDNRFWTFFAATTSVEFTVAVTDTAAGVTREYFKPQGATAPAVTDTQAFATCP